MVREVAMQESPELGGQLLVERLLQYRAREPEPVLPRQGETEASVDVLQ